MPSIRCFHKVKLCWNYELTFSRWLSSSLYYAIQKKTTLVEENKLKQNRDSDEKDKPSAAVKSTKHYNLLLEYFDSRQCPRNELIKIPKTYLSKKYADTKCLYIVDRDAARKLFEAMEPHLVSFKGYVLEANAGVGFLTSHLLEAGFPGLRIYEADLGLYKELQNIVNKYNSDARLFNLNLLNLWSMVNLDDKENRFGTAFEGISPRAWDDDPVFKLIVAVPNNKFIVHIMQSIVFQFGICLLGRAEFLITMPAREYAKLTSTPDQGYYLYKGASVLFQLFFEYIYLTTVPEKVFVPWFIKKYDPDVKTKEDFGAMILVQITPRKDIFEKIPPHLIKPFWFFVISTMRAPSTKIIPALEKWIPGIGVKLISKGYTIYTPVGHLHPEQFLETFLLFSSSSEFSTCSFLPAMERLVMKLTNPDMTDQVGSRTISETVHNEDKSTLVYGDIQQEILSEKQE